MPALLANPARRYSRILACDPSLAAQIATVITDAPQAAVETVSRDALEAILPDGAVHQGIAVLASPLENTPLEEICDQANALPRRQATIRCEPVDQEHAHIHVVSQPTALPEIPQ